LLSSFSATSFPCLTILFPSCNLFPSMLCPDWLLQLSFFGWVPVLYLSFSASLFQRNFFFVAYISSILGKPFLFDEFFRPFGHKVGDRELPLLIFGSFDSRNEYFVGRFHLGFACLRTNALCLLFSPAPLLRWNSPCPLQALRPYREFFPTRLICIPDHLNLRQTSANVAGDRRGGLLRSSRWAGTGKKRYVRQNGGSYSMCYKLNASQPSPVNYFFPRHTLILRLFFSIPAGEFPRQLPSSSGCRIFFFSFEISTLTA